MNADQSNAGRPDSGRPNGPAQTPGPHEGDRPRAHRDPYDPTATAPASVEHSVYEETDFAGTDASGVSHEPDANDPPAAARKSAGAHGDGSGGNGDGGSSGDGSDDGLNRPGEGSDDESLEPLTDVAEKPGSDEVPHEHADRLADEWGEDSFPSSDPPAHY